MSTGNPWIDQQPCACDECRASGSPLRSHPGPRLHSSRKRRALTVLRAAAIVAGMFLFLAMLAALLGVCAVWSDRP